MPWNPIATQNVLDRFTPAEQSAVAAIQGGAGTSLQNILNDACSQAQAMILAGGNEIDQPGSVPDQIRPQVIAIALWEWISSIPGAKQLCTDERKGLYDRAQKRLEAIASQDPQREKIEPPQTPSAVPGAVGQAQFRADRRRMTHRQLSGLI